MRLLYAVPTQGTVSLDRLIPKQETTGNLELQQLQAFPKGESLNQTRRIVRQTDLLLSNPITKLSTPCFRITTGALDILSVEHHHSIMPLKFHVRFGQRRSDA